MLEVTHGRQSCEVLLHPPLVERRTDPAPCSCPTEAAAAGDGGADMRSGDPPSSGGGADVAPFAYPGGGVPSGSSLGYPNMGTLPFLQPGMMPGAHNSQLSSSNMNSTFHGEFG